MNLLLLPGVIQAVTNLNCASRVAISEPVSVDLRTLTAFIHFSSIIFLDKFKCRFHYCGIGAVWAVLCPSGTPWSLGCAVPLRHPMESGLYPSGTPCRLGCAVPLWHPMESGLCCAPRHPMDGWCGGEVVSVSVLCLCLCLCLSYTSPPNWPRGGGMGLPL